MNSLLHWPTCLAVVPPAMRRVLGAMIGSVAVGVAVFGQQGGPTFSNVTVHDPSVVRVDSTFYVFGSHLASARTTDLLKWAQLSTSPAPGNALVPNAQLEFQEALAWVGSDTFWAPDVIRLNDGRYYYYYCVGRLDQPRAALGLAISNSIAGPYTNAGIMLRSGMFGQPSEDGRNYDPTFHPNTVDPAVFFDQAGKFWMVYGSYSGGVFILEMNSATGFPIPGQGYGKKLIGGNHARIEAAYILYSPDSGYYYLFLSFGGLGANDGYNIRLGRSRTPDGPYFDASGANLTAVAGGPGTLFDDASIAPFGVKLMGSYQFLHAPSEPGSTSRGYRSPGHNSAHFDRLTSKYSLVFHTRFVNRGEQHEVRVHPMFLNEEGWLVVGPHRYAGETLGVVDTADIPGDYKLINHGKAISGTVNTSTAISLNANRSIGGAVSGDWQLAGDNFATFDLGGTAYRGIFVRQWDDDSRVWVMTFSALSGNGVAVWGSKLAAVAADVAPFITRQPTGVSVAPGASLRLAAGANGSPPPTFQWKKDGAPIAGATGNALTLSSATITDAGLYTIEATNISTAASVPAIVGITSTSKAIGTAAEVGADILHPTGNVYDQVLLQGKAATITADAGQVTRISYIDLTNDIVQVEFSGAGTLTLSLDASSGPSTPLNYNQPSVSYLKGHARIVISGANETSNVSVFSVGRANAVNQALFRDDVTYDGWADVASLAISSTDGKFGGLRTANANFISTAGITGVYAPGVQFSGPVNIGNVSASDSATPMIVIGGAAGGTRIAGGDLLQPNGQHVVVAGLTALEFVNGTSSHGTLSAARANRARLRLHQSGADVTDQIVVNPP
ncbi:MAG: glycoside hydrolase family 43 C-terminal domain-containing protein [Opitutaceae bacterium]